MRKMYGDRVSFEDQQVLWGSAMEPPFDNKYNYNFEKGIYRGVISKNVLFSSKDKLSSEDGWPLFSESVDED